MNISLNLKNIDRGNFQDLGNTSLASLKSGTGKGNDFIGWLNIADESLNLVDRINATAKRLSKISDAVICIGIGGSYLGAKAGLDFLRSPNYNQLKKDTPNIYFVGNNLSNDYINEVISLIGDGDFSINVISKSGTTTEPAIAFRIFRELLIKKYGMDNIKDRIVCTTDSKKGLLKEFADKEGYETYVIPDNVGGRYSVLTPVGLLPLAIAGCDIKEILLGARDFKEKGEDLSLTYAITRYNMYNLGMEIELFSSFNPKLVSLSEWWKQLYGESEGKDHKGLFPSSVTFTTDLHSMGQYIQDGKRILFETFVDVEKENTSLVIPETKNDEDNLNYLKGKDVSYVNHTALLATEEAHLTGGVPNMELTLKDFSERTFGETVSFFELACGISGYMLDVNPFNQPGVEEYKKNMFRLLGKPTK